MDGQKTSLSQVVGGLAGAIGHPEFPKGDLAELRRMMPGCPPPAYWRLLVNKVPPDFRHGLQAEHAWASIMQGMAIMAPDIHAPTQELGKVMAGLETPTSEHRFWRLLRSRLMFGYLNA